MVHVAHFFIAIFGQHMKDINYKQAEDVMALADLAIIDQVRTQFGDLLTGN